MRRLLTQLLVLTLALRCLVPAGFMLESAGGEMLLVICTGQGPQTITLDADGKPVPEKPRHSDTGLCPYASIGATAPNDGAPKTLESTTHYAVVVYRVTQAVFVAAPLRDATSARGPPSFQT